MPAAHGTLCVYIRVKFQAPGGLPRMQATWPSLRFGQAPDADRWAAKSYLRCRLVIDEATHRSYNLGREI